MKNVKIILMSLVTLLSVQLSSSQDSFGFIAGMTFSNNSLDPSTGFDPNTRTDFAFGILADFEISERFSFQPQLMYLTRGSNIGITGFTEEVEVKASYLEIPLLLKYELIAESDFHALFGLNTGILLNATQEASFIPADQEDIKDENKSLNFSFAVGIGKEFSLGEKSTLVIQTLYGLGLTNIDDDDSPGDFTETIRSRHFLINVGIVFPL
jgi:hypothetical protein